MRKAVFISVLAGFSLFGCITDNPSRGQTAATGSARIKLPQLPEGFKDSIPGSGYSLTVTVTGPGMQPLSHAWALSEYGGQTVSFEDIPAGPNRVFMGVLMRGKAKTHEGKYSLDIGAGESVFVPLVLREVGTGRAEICVEVEGWPGSPDCTPIDTLPVDTSALAGCWHIDADDGIGPVSGTLSLHPTAHGSFGDFLSDSGQSLLASAEFAEGAWNVRVYPMIFETDTVKLKRYAEMLPVPNIEKPFSFPQDTGKGRSFQFRIKELSAGPADEPNGLFWGIMLDPTLQRMVGEIRGTAASCLVQPVPVDTLWKRPVIIPDIPQNPIPDTLTIILPPPNPDFNSP